jgi:hypothetical protein
MFYVGLLCNNHKYTHTEAIDPVSGNVVPLFHPRQQDWVGHFAWTEDFLRIIGVTQQVAQPLSFLN